MALRDEFQLCLRTVQPALATQPTRANGNL